MNASRTRTQNRIALAAVAALALGNVWMFLSTPTNQWTWVALPTTAAGPSCVVLALRNSNWRERLFLAGSLQVLIPYAWVLWMGKPIGIQVVIGVSLLLGSSLIASLAREPDREGLI